MLKHKKLIKKHAKKQNIPIKVRTDRKRKGWKIILKTGNVHAFEVLYNYLILKGYYAKHIPMVKQDHFVVAVNKELTVEAEVWFFDKKKEQLKLIGKTMVNPKDMSNECERIFGTLQNAHLSHPFRTRSMDVGDFIKFPDGMCYIVDSTGWAKSRAITENHFNQKYCPNNVWIRAFFASGLHKSNTALAFKMLEDVIAREMNEISVAPAKNFMPTIEDYWQFWINQNYVWW